MKNKNQLPVLNHCKTKPIFERDRHKIEDLLFENARNRLTHKDYRHQDQFQQIKAANFLSRINTIDGPDVIFAVADHVGLSSSSGKENQLHRMSSQSFRSTQYRLDTKRMGEERLQAIHLAKWIDEKLLKFRQKKTITFLDILQYKQTILNYALGKIIDSLTKKCREEGQLLSLIWNNTFTMFEGVFNILASANSSKDKEKISHQKQLSQIYETNHNFLREENTTLLQENQAIFQKMKSVINWNKRLRKQRKRLHTENRILNYRNHTYHLALQQTVQMLLRLVPEPATIHTAKKIIEKLSKEKGRKKKFLHSQSDQQFVSSTKQYVYKWLKRNSFVHEDTLQWFREEPGQKEDRHLQLEDLSDLSEMKNINIYDYFKLYDIGVQFSPQICTSACQSQQLQKKNAEVMTKAHKTVDNSCQTAIRNITKTNIDDVRKKGMKSNSKQTTINRLMPRQKSRKNIDKDIIASQRSIKSTKKHLAVIPASKEVNGKFHQRISYRQTHKIDSPVKINRVSALSNKRTDHNVVGFKKKKQYQRQESIDFDNCSISGVEEDGNNTKQNPTTKYFATNRSINSQIKSIRNSEEFSISSATMEKFNGKFITKKTKKMSVAYVFDRHHSKNDRNTPKINLKKRFNDTYQQNRKRIDQNKEEFYDQLIRRRSFYGKQKVQFANFSTAEDAQIKTKELLRGRPVKNRQKMFHGHSKYLYGSIQKLTKKFAGPSNIVKTKTLVNSQSVFSTIRHSIEQIARIPPNNKLFVSNSLVTITKYIEGLLPQYIKQVKKEKEELKVDDEKVFYPLSYLLMEQMTFKYGLKGIAQRKIKGFIEKVLTFAPISQKVQLFSILLGLEQTEVGTDQLLVYLKCLVYFDCKKAFRDTVVSDSSTVDVEVVRENLPKILEYFFDEEYLNLIQLKLEVYFQQTAPYSTVEGISVIIIKELLRRKKQLKQKYVAIYNICSVGDNFFTNIFKIIKMISSYTALSLSQQQSYQKGKRSRESAQIQGAVQKIKNRDFSMKKPENTKKIIHKTYSISEIGQIIKELLQRSDIIDEEFGKSITLERFINGAVISGIPTLNELEPILDFFRNKFEDLQCSHPIYAAIECEGKGLDQLAHLWTREPIKANQDRTLNRWSLAKLFVEKVDQEVASVMGKLGSLGLYIQSSILTIQSCK